MKKHIAALLVVSLLTPQARAVDEDKSLLVRTCLGVMRSLPGGSRVLNYFYETKVTSGRRLISVPKRTHIRPSPQSRWFWTPELARKSRLQVIPKKLTQRWEGGPYELRPLKTLQDLTWGNYTEKRFGRREEFSKPVKWITGIVLTLIMFGGADIYLDYKTAEGIKTAVAAKPDFYNFFLFHDYRARDIRGAVLHQNLSLKEARFLVYMDLERVNADWFANRSFHISQSTNFLRTKLLSFPLFFPLSDWVINGVHPRPGYSVSKLAEGPLSDGQVRQLFDQNDQLAIKQEFIMRWLNTPYLLENYINPQLFTPELKASVTEDPTNKELMQLYREGKIGQGDAMYGMQENEFWKTDFEHNKTLRITELTNDGTQPLTLEEIQKEIKIEALQHAKGPRKPLNPAKP